MPQKPGPQGDLLAKIRSGQTIEARMTTYQHGWLKACQVAQKAGPVAFGEWISTQLAILPELGTAVIVGAGQASGAGTMGGGS